VLYFQVGKPTQRLKGFKGRLRGFERFLKPDFAESAKRYRRFTCQRSRGLATTATGISEGGGIGEDLHRCMQTLTSRRPLSQETAERNFNRLHGNLGYV
jgi:hypothetical protein